MSEFNLLAGGSRQLFIVAAVLALCAAAGPALAEPYEFANFTQVAANKPFSFTEVDAGYASLGYDSGTLVDFHFTPETGLSTEDRRATLSIQSNIIIVPGVEFAHGSEVGPFFYQGIPPTTTLQLTENSTGKNLLTMQFTGVLVGVKYGQSGSIPSAPWDTVVFTSDYLTFPTPSENGYTLGLQTITPSLSLDQNGFINNFRANVQGQFSAYAVPEPASLVLLGTGLVAVVGMAAIRRRREKTGA